MKNDNKFFEEIYKEYISSEISISKLAKKYKIDRSTINRNFKRLNLSLKEKSYDKLNDIDFWKKVYDEYMSEDGTSLKIEKKYKIDSRTIKKYFNKFGFKLKEKSEINKIVQSTYKKTSVEKYGVENPFQNEEIKNKIKKTNLERYGVESHNSSEKVKQKKKEVFLKKYGVENPNQVKEFKEKSIQTNLKKYNKQNPFQDENIIKKIKKFRLLKSYDLLQKKIKNEYKILNKFRGIHLQKKGWILYKFKCLKCNHMFETPLYQGQPKCPKCYPSLHGKSKLENEIESFINSLGFKTIRNRKLISPYEIDIYIPEKNIGIEINGIYYHNSNPKSYSYKDRNYHKMKTDLAREKGIKLIHIWDCFDLNIYKSMIRNLLGKTKNKIYARNCQIKGITKEEEILFLNENHIHGYTQSNKSSGLFYQNELVSVISFRKHKEGIEIARFASKLNTNVIGGFSKLLRHSDIKEDIITYCDIEFCPFMTDSVYYKNGFTFVKETNPKLYFTDYHKLYSRQEFMKHKLKNKLEKYDENLTTQENLYLNNIYPVYSTGNWKFIKYETFQ